MNLFPDPLPRTLIDWNQLRRLKGHSFGESYRTLVIYYWKLIKLGLRMTYLTCLERNEGNILNFLSSTVLKIFISSCTGTVFNYISPKITIKAMEEEEKRIPRKCDTFISTFYLYKQCKEIKLEIIN